ncbi:MAG TPA: FHA domain-containing protein [Planctomycetota bacterium]|nr:FHA domain-containing protein [Planctomycetota bacterium]
MPTLQIISGEQEGSEINWTADEIFIGKEDGCEVKITDAGVSRKHAKLAKKGAGWFVEDLGSSNGTYVNFKKRGKNEPTDLADRDIIFIGRTVAKFWLNGAPKTVDSGHSNGTQQTGGVLSATELRDLLRGVVPIAGLTCPSCNASLEEDMKAKVREQEQVELIRRLKLHELDPASLDRLIAQASQKVRG